MSGVVRHKLNNSLNLAHVRFGLVGTPPVTGVVPDLLQVGLVAGDTRRLFHWLDAMS